MPISLETVRALARLLPEADLTEITIETVAFQGDAGESDNHPVSLTLRRAAPARAATQPPAPVSNDPIMAAAEDAEAALEIAIHSPSVGIFRPARTPLQVGDAVKIGQVVGAVESLKVPSEVKAAADGRVRAILAEDGQGVEFGQPLFSLEPLS